MQANLRYDIRYQSKLRTDLGFNISNYFQMIALSPNVNFLAFHGSIKCVGKKKPKENGESQS